MKVKENKIQQAERLKAICNDKNIDYNSMNSLVESVKAKKMKRNNYHQQKIADVIQKAIK